MLASTFSAFFAIAVSAVSAQSNNVCQATPYRGLSCLNGNAAAAGACSSGVANQTVTITSTTSVLSVITSAASATQVVDQVTVNITSFETSTVTITAGEPSTTYSPVIATTCISSTITTYYPATPTAKRAKRQSAAAACTSQGLAYLDIIADVPNVLATACSCIGNAAPTTTITKYVTSLVSSTAVSYAAGEAPTTTAYFIDRLTCTETQTPPPVVIPVSTTTTITETSTVSFVAPTFTQIYGPTAGCADLGVGTAHLLDASVVDHQNAVAMCKDVCEQEPTCKFLYVQRMFTDYGGAKPYFECYMNDHEFNELTDLQCGQKPGIYATARGFDACGRGGPQATVAPES